MPAWGPDTAAPPAECWRVGDLAECIWQLPWFCTNPYCPALTHDGPCYGDIRAVAALVDLGAPGLMFARWPGVVFSAGFFRRITPRADPRERADPSFIANPSFIDDPAPAKPETR